MKSRLIDIKTAADRLGISVSTLYQGLAGSSELRRVKLGTKVVFLEADVDAFIRSKLREAEKSRAQKLELFKKNRDIRRVISFRKGGARSSAE